MKKKHPHKRAIDAEERKKLRATGKAWWVKKGKAA
jgi:hypothetical protein